MTAWDDHFASRKWRVLSEADGKWDAGEDGLDILFSHGRFDIASPGVFQSPLSHNKGRRGVVLQEVSDGRDVPGSVIAVGEQALERARASGALSLQAGADLMILQPG